MIKFAERIWIFYFYILISIFLLHLLSIILDYSVILLHYSICNQFLIFFTPIINDNLFIDHTSLESIFYINNINLENDDLGGYIHPRNSIDPSLSHLPIGRLIEHAHIDYNVLKAKIAQKVLRGKVVPKSVLAYINLGTLAKHEVISILKWWGYDTSYIYFKTVEPSKIDYGILFTKPISARNGIDDPSIPYLSTKAPSFRIISSFVITNSNASLPVLDSSSLNNSLNSLSSPISSSGIASANVGFIDPSTIIPPRTFSYQSSPAYSVIVDSTYNDYCRDLQVIKKPVINDSAACSSSNIIHPSFISIEEDTVISSNLSTPYYSDCTVTSKTPVRSNFISPPYSSLGDNTSSINSSLLSPSYTFDSNLITPSPSFSLPVSPQNYSCLTPAPLLLEEDIVIINELGSSVLSTSRYLPPIRVQPDSISDPLNLFSYSIDES